MTDTTFEFETPTAGDIAPGIRRELPTFAGLNRKVAGVRDETDLLSADVKELHHETAREALSEEAAVIARSDPYSLLDELGTTFGLSWTSVARMIAVTPTAIRKWRKGETISADSRSRLALASAFMRWVDRYPIEHPASWVEMSVSPQTTLRHIDLFEMGRTDLLLELVGGRMTAHAALDEVDPDWRQNYGVDDRFGVVVAGDGRKSIVVRRNV